MHFQRERRMGRVVPLLGLAVILGMLGLSSPPCADGVRAADRSEPGSGGAVLQLTAGGHALGFGESRVFFASGDHMLSVEFVGGRMAAPVVDEAATEPSGLKPAAGQAPSLEKVSYSNVWDGVTVAFEKSDHGIVESSYLIEAGTPGRPVKNIRLSYNRPIRIDGHGDLVIAYERGEMRESAPVAWQEREGMKFPVDVAFRSLSSHEIGFELGDYDRSLDVMIDPVLTWHAFLGGSNYDYGHSIAVDASGNVYVAGYSRASWGSPIIRAYSFDSDAFAAKLDSGGNLIWNTFLGGDGTDYGNGIAVDGSGHVYVVGDSLATWGSPIRVYTSGRDAFAAKLDSGGNLTWHTFLGGDGTDGGRGIAVDGSGHVYVGGHSWGTWGSPIRAYTSNDDAFAAKLDSGGNLTWNTFLGGSDDDVGYGIAVDGSGNVYVGGGSEAAWGSPIRAYSSDSDAFAAKLDSGGTLTWHTFLGGGSSDNGRAIAVDGSGHVYVGGHSWGTWGSPIRAYSSNADAFAAKLDSGGNLTWHTFLGGGGSDYGRGIAVGRSGNVYVSGESAATWGSPIRAFTSNWDAYATRLDSGGNLNWNTFLGGSSFDFGYGIAVDASGNVYVGGGSEAAWGSPIRGYTPSGSDAFAAKIYDTSSKDNLLGTWDGQGVYFRDSDTGTWAMLSSPADLIACGDLYGDGIDDLIGIWSGQAGVWVKNSANGSWAYLGSSPRHIAAGDMNGDGRADLLGTWDGQGVFYRDSMAGTWNQMATPATLITAGDLDGDNKSDLIGIWPSQAGVWAKFSQSDTWSYIGSSLRDMATGDMNGDGRTDLVGTWDGQGVFYRDSMTGNWIMMATPADQVAAGDLDGDGTDDLIGIWAGQAGVWVKYSATGSWAYVGSSARDIATGRMSGGLWGSGLSKPMPLASPMGGFADGPSRYDRFENLSSEGPGGNRFILKRGENLVPKIGKSEKARVPGPGESGFRYTLQKNLWPQAVVIKK